MTKTTYQLFVERHYSAGLAILSYIVSQFAKEGVEVAASAVMLLSPLPNAISVYKITQVQMGFSPFQAFAFSATIEVAVFFLIEVALLMLTRWLQGKPAYKYAFYGMCVVVVVVAGIVINFVYHLDPFKVMAWLPVLSIGSFIAIALKRWDARNMEPKVKTARVIPESDSRVIPGDSQNQRQTIPAPDYTRVIIDYYRDSPLASQRKAANDLGISQPKISKTLSELEASGIIHRNGNGVEILKGV